MRQEILLNGVLKLKKILFIFGTRPEAVKMIPLIKEFQKDSSFLTELCVSAQHRQMLDEVLDFFKIKPHYDLDIMKPAQDLFDITGKVLKKLRPVIKKAKPDLIFVHGDTSTAFAASLAAFYCRVGVAHIEAGLRSNELYSPFPEEANRRLIGVLSHYHFVPTQTARDNLLREDKTSKNIIITGNTVVDALKLTLKLIEKNPSLVQKELQKHYVLNENRKILLVTAHRRENFGKGLKNICQALEKIALNNKNIDILYPLHPNPNVLEPAKRFLSKIPNVFLLPPLRYEVFVYLMSRAYFIMSDSGGIQEEAPSLKKPVLLLRENTERPEALQCKAVKLVGTDCEEIYTQAQRLLNDASFYEQMRPGKNPYGDGRACERIVSFIKKTLKEEV